MTDQSSKLLVASFNAGKAYRAPFGAPAIQLTQVGSLAALLAAVDLGYEPVTTGVKQFNSCKVRVEMKDKVTGAIQAALMINSTGKLWKDGPLAAGAIEKVTAAVTDAHQKEAARLIESGEIEL